MTLTAEQSDPRCVCGHSIQSHSWSGCNAYVRPSVGGAGACCTRTPADIVAALIAEAVEQARAEVAEQIDQMRIDLTDESVPREKWGRHVNGWATGMERAAHIARGEVTP